jgi:hypothetical protein
MRRGQKKPFTTTELEALRSLTAGNPFQRAILGVAVDTMLRASDLLALRVSTVRDDAGVIRETFATGQRKDENRTVIVALTPKTREALAAHILHAGITGDAKLFPICHRTFQRMVQSWARRLGLDPSLYSGHSMRRTKAAIIGVRSNGVMTVIADWPHVPTQPEVQREIDGASNGYVAFAPARRPQSCLLTGRRARVEDGIGRLGLAGGEACCALRLQSKAACLLIPIAFGRPDSSTFSQKNLLVGPRPLLAALPCVLLGRVPAGKELLCCLFVATLHFAHARMWSASSCRS